MLAVTQTSQDVLVDLGRLIDALGEYRRMAILAGGFVPLMYRRMSDVVLPQTPPLLTTDFDWTLPAHMDVLGGRSLAERLADSRFVTISSLGTEPPVQRYQHERFGTKTLGPVYAEFLAPLVGSEIDRRGRPRSVVVVQPGLTPQALHYLDLLFVEPMPFDASTWTELSLKESTTILLPNPASYVAQKLLAWPDRVSKKRDKDLAYVYDVAVLTQEHWPDLANVVVRLKRSFPKVWFDRIGKLVGRLFESVASEGPIAIARQYQGIPGRVPTESATWKTVANFSKAIGLD